MLTHPAPGRRVLLWLFRILARQAHFLLLCTASKPNRWLVFLRGQSQQLQSSGLSVHREIFLYKKTERTCNINIGPIHDVFVDTHTHFESRSNTQPHSCLEQRARLLINFFQAALLAEFAHWYTPVTTLVPLPSIRFYPRLVLMRIPCAWIRE